MQNKFAAIAMIMICMIGMTGFAAATTVTYIGDGTYNANFDGEGTGDLTINTYIGNYMDRLTVEWNDADMYGKQSMTNPAECGWTEIDRDVTVSIGNFTETSSGTITTKTNDIGDSTVVMSMGEYVGLGNINTDQIVKFGTGIGTELDDADGVVAGTVITGNTCGEDAYAVGIVSAYSEDAHSEDAQVVTGVNMSYGGFVLDTFGGAGAVPGYAGAAMRFNVTANGAGTFETYMGFVVLVDEQFVFTGVDEHGMDVDITDDIGTINYDSYGTDVFVILTDPISGDVYEATGYVYAIDL